MTKKSILVTGSSGFIGSHVLRTFKLQGHESYGLGRRSKDASNYIQHDLCLPLHLDKKPDVVVHAAALSSPWGSKASFEKNNVLTTQNILDFCAASGYPKLVFISSSSVYYEHAHQFAITEATPFPEKPINHYAATKRQAEALVQEYEGEWVILRPRAVFGPEDSVIFPRLLEAARAGRLPLLSSDTPVVGDLIYIDSLVDYIMQASLRSDVQGIFNVTNNQTVEILEFVLDVFSELGIAAPKRNLPVKRALQAAAVLENLHRLFLPNKEPSITRYGVSVFAYSKTFDVSKMLSVMGKPKVSIEEGKERFVDWVKSSESYY